MLKTAYLFVAEHTTILKTAGLSLYGVGAVIDIFESARALKNDDNSSDPIDGTIID